MGLLLGCSCGSKPRHGDVVTIRERCIWALTDDAYEQMTEYCNHKDERSLEIMEKIGLVGIFEVGESGKVVDMAIGRYKILTSDNKEVWVASEFVK